MTSLNRNYVPDCWLCVGDGKIARTGPADNMDVWEITCEECGGTGKWKPGSRCPCGCGVQALKLTKRQHVVGCSCRSCLGARNRRKGQSAQKRMHRALGGTGTTPSNEEWAAGYELIVMVQPESKKGSQTPAAFTKFISGDWFRRALRQAEMATAPGKYPAVYLEPEGSQQGWLIVRLS